MSGEPARTAERLAAVLGTRNDVLLVGAEAMLALEATATSLAAPGRRVVNVVTSPYGGWFGAWLARAGAEVTELRPTGPRRAIAAEDVAEVVRVVRPEIVAMVHGEASSGLRNPVEEVAGIAHDAGAIVVVDAVASVGGHPLWVDEWGLDVVVVGPQKALGGPVSLSAIAVSPAAWELAAEPIPEVPSALSLAGLRRDGFDVGTPDPEVFRAMARALDELCTEGLDARIARHAEAAGLARDGIRTAGWELWIERDAEASHLVTTIAVPEGRDAATLLAAATPLDGGFSAGVGDGAHRFVRLNHTGARATPAAVEAALAALAVVA